MPIMNPPVCKHHIYIPHTYRHIIVTTTISVPKSRVLSVIYHHIYTYIHTYTKGLTYIHTYKYIHTYIHMYKRRYIQVHTYIHA